MDNFDPQARCLAIAGPGLCPASRAAITGTAEVIAGLAAGGHRPRGRYPAGDQGAHAHHPHQPDPDLGLFHRRGAGGPSATPAPASKGRRAQKTSANPQLRFYADWVNADRYLPPSAISNSVARALLEAGLTSAERLALRRSPSLSPPERSADDHPARDRGPFRGSGADPETSAEPARLRARAAMAAPGRITSTRPEHAYGYEEARMRVIPNPREIQRMEEALEWLALIGGESEQAIIDNRRIVWMRAEGHRWKQICRAVGCVRSTAWRRWTAALVTIANRLNKQRKTSRRPHGAKTTGDAAGAKRGGEGREGAAVRGAKGSNLGRDKSRRYGPYSSHDRGESRPAAASPGLGSSAAATLCGGMSAPVL